MAQGQQENGQTVGQLVSSASKDMSTLVRSEVALAKAEIKQEVKKAGQGGAMFGAAGFVAVLAVILLSIAAAYGIVALGLGPGWAFLIVGGAYLLLAALIGLIGFLRVRKLGPPERTIRTVKDNVAFAKSPRGPQNQQNHA